MIEHQEVLLGTNGNSRSNTQSANSTVPVSNARSVLIPNSYISRNSSMTSPTPFQQKLNRLASKGKGAANFSKRAIGGVANVSKRYVPKGLKTATKLAARGIGAGTVATIGIAAGLASDDYGDVLKYGLMGATGGYALGGKAFDSTLGAASGVKNAAVGVKDSFQQGYYGDDYEVIKADKQWQKSKDVDKHLRQQFGENWEQVKEQQLQLRKLGVTDQADLDTAYKLMQNPDTALNTKEAASLMKFKKDVTRSELMDKESRKNIENQVINLVGPEQKDRVMKALGSIHNVDISS